MAALHRHWKWLVVNFVLLAALLSVALKYVHSTATAQNLPASEVLSPSNLLEGKKLSVVAYQEIQQLREQLAVNNLDLGAMGFTGAEVAALLERLSGWYEQNQQALHRADNETMQARSRLQEAMRAMNVGPASPGHQQAYQAASARLVAANESRQQLFNSAASILSPLMAGQKQQTWNTARTQSGEYRYVPGLTEAQRVGLARAARSQNQRPDGMNQVLTAAQQTALAMALQNQQQRMPEIIAAEEAVLPLPQELKEIGKPAEGIREEEMQLQ